MGDKNKSTQQLMAELAGLRQQVAALQAERLLAKEAHRQAETALQESEERFRRLLAAEREQRLLAETLGDIFLALTAQTSREAVLDEILRQMQRVVAHSAANIVLLEDNVLRIVRWQGYQPFGSEGLLSSLEQPLNDFPLDAQVVQTRRPLLVADTGQTPGWVAVAESAWIRSFVAVPICLQEQVLGLLRLDSDTPHKFSARDIERLQPLANAAAIALENARLYDQARRELAERQQVEQAVLELNRKLLALQYAGATIASSLDLAYVLDTVTREMVNLLAVEGCTIYEWHQRADTVLPMADHGLADWWAENILNRPDKRVKFPLIRQVLSERHARQITISRSDIDADELASMQARGIKTLLMLPMEFGDQMVGLVEVMDSRVERIFNIDEIALAQLLANQAAIAVENARLYAQAQQELAERRQVEKELRRVAAKNQAILNAIPDSMFYFNRDGRLLDYKVANSGNLTPGILSEVIIDNNPGDRSGPPSTLVHLIRPYIDQTLVSGEMQVFEYRLSRPQGIKDFETRLVVSGPNEVLAIIRDITRHKAMQKALQKSEANLRVILDNSLQAFILIDSDHKIQAFNKIANDRVKQILGRAFKEGASIYDFIPETDLQRFRPGLDEALQGRPVTIEQKVTIEDTDKWFEFNYKPVFADDDRVLGVCFCAIDIDQRKRATEALAASEARLLAEMQSILVITRILVREIDLNNLLEFIITQAEHLVNASGAAVLLLGEDGQELEMAAPGESWLQIKSGARIPLKDSLAEAAISSQQVQISNSAQDDDRTVSIRALLQPTEVQSLLCAPLVVQRKNLGVLLIWDKRRQPFTRHDSRLIGLFADQAALALHNAHLHTRNRQLAIEQERHRLARDLHDTVTQSLYSMGLAAQAALRLLGQDTNTPIGEPIEYIERLARTALAEMREHLFQLDPTTLAETGLIEAIARHCDMLSKRHALAIEFRPDQPAPSLSLRQQEALYYITREALWNVIRHANASRVKIGFMEEKGEVILSIIDNGVGFDPAAFSAAETMGLRNMAERARSLGASLELQSRPGQGVRVTVQIPRQLPESIG